MREMRSGERGAEERGGGGERKRGKEQNWGQEEEHRGVEQSGDGSGATAATVIVTDEGRLDRGDWRGDRERWEKVESSEMSK